MTRLHEFPILILSPIYPCSQVDLPPDIHPLPESVNAYVSQSSSASTHDSPRLPAPPQTRRAPLPSPTHIKNFRDPASDWTDLNTFLLLSSSTHSRSSPTSSTQNPTVARRSLRSRRGAMLTSARAKTRSSGGSARRCVASRLGSSRSAHRLCP